MLDGLGMRSFLSRGVSKYRNRENLIGLECLKSYREFLLLEFLVGDMKLKMVKLDL